MFLCEDLFVSLGLRPRTRRLLSHAMNLYVLEASQQKWQEMPLLTRHAELGEV